MRGPNTSTCPSSGGRAPHGEGPFNRGAGTQLGSTGGLAAHRRRHHRRYRRHDTIPDRDAVLAAVQQAHRHRDDGPGTTSVRVALDARSTVDLTWRGHAPADWSGLPGKRSEEFVSCVVVVPGPVGRDGRP